MIKAGDELRVKYPFVVVTYTAFDEEGCRDVRGWAPGCDSVRTAYDYESDDVCYYAAAEGEMILTVLSTHKIPGRSEYVFYTRQWKNPDGKVFGKGNVRIKTMRAFKNICEKFRYSYVIDEDRP